MSISTFEQPVINRRNFIVSLMLVPYFAAAQQPGKVWRIGYLSGLTRPADGAPPPALRRAFEDLGYVDGKNVTYVARFAEGDGSRLPVLAAEIVALNVDLLMAFGSPPAEALKVATSSVPIVIGGAGDTVGTGLVASLAHPGGNVTGIDEQATELSAKRLELLKEAVPKASRIAILWNADDRAMTLRYQEIEKAARSLGVAVQPLGVRKPDDFETAFAAMTREPPDALFLVTDALTNLNRKRVLEFASARRMPAMYENVLAIRDGGLMSYGPDPADGFRQMAVYADRILRGAKPADLPVEQPNRYYLIFNLTTAKALGLTIPQSLLLRADEVIQ